MRRMLVKSNKYAYIGLVLLFIGMLIFLNGCASVQPTGLQTYWNHTSHPLAGPPFGPTHEEDSLDTANVDLIWERKSWFLELGVGYKLADGGFYGPKLTGNVRTGYRFKWDNAWRVE
jgi:hypothetical protein